MPYWREPEEIGRLSLIAVAPREGTELPALPFQSERIVPVQMPYIGITATDLREKARAGRSLRYLVPDSVAAYIEEEGLYRGDG